MSQMPDASTGVNPEEGGEKKKLLYADLITEVVSNPFCSRQGKKVNFKNHQWITKTITSKL